MLKKIVGIGLMGAAFVVEFFWLGLTFGSVIVGIVLLLFAPHILLAPFNILMALGLGFYHHEKIEAYRREWERQQDYFRHQEYQFDAGAYARDDLARYYETLGCEPDADMEQVKQAYRRMSRQYHPDAVAAKGLGQEFMEFAKRKMQEINEAYQAIRRAHRRAYGASAA